MPLQPVYTFPLEHVHLSPRMPLSVHWDYYPSVSDSGGTNPTPALKTGGLTRTNRHEPFALPHDHDFYEVALVVGGTAKHVTDAGTDTIRRGTVVVIPRGQVHGYDMYHNFEVLNLFYIAEWLAEDLSDVWRHQALVRLFMGAALFETALGVRVHSVQLDEARLAACLHELHDIARQQSRPQPNLLFLRACLMKLLVLLHEAYARVWGGDEGHHFRRKIWSVLEEVERRIGLGMPVNVAAMASACGWSPEHLTREFRRATGLSIMRYFQQRRLQRATRMLLAPEMSITEVAHTLGFSDYAHFRRRFVDYYGISPGEFRRSNRSS